MFSTDLNFQKDLATHHVLTAWQFIEYTRKNINIVEYCANMIEKIIAQMSQQTSCWEQELFSSSSHEETVDGKRVRRTTITTKNLPTYEVEVVGEKVDPWFLFEKLLRDFYQYTMNSFDSIGQIANSGLLANNGKKVDSVNFQRMALCFSQITYSTAFPKTSSWFNGVSQSPEFQYIEAINNRTKHTANVSNKLSMGILGSKNTTRIGSFVRRDVQHTKQEIGDQLEATLVFLNTSWSDFLKAFCDEYVLDIYTADRFHEIGGVYQHKIKDDPAQDVSYAYIPVTSDFSMMPDEIRVLLVHKTEEEVEARCAPFTKILVRDTDNKTILGQYVAEDAVGDDCLLHYRKYVKDTSTFGSACVFNIMQEPSVFYHYNRFFTITSISDDEEFLNRVSMPF